MPIITQRKKWEAVFRTDARPFWVLSYGLYTECLLERSELDIKSWSYKLRHWRRVGDLLRKWLEKSLLVAVVTVYLGRPAKQGEGIEDQQLGAAKGGGQQESIKNQGVGLQNRQSTVRSGWKEVPTQPSGN